MEHENRSVRRTKKALRDSLIELMKTRSILSIGVNEICAAADVGRSTFYTHYHDQYDLLQSIEDEARAFFRELDLFRKIGKLGKREITALVMEVLQYIESNSSSIQVLLSENGDLAFQRKMFHYFTLDIQRVMKDISKKEDVSAKAEYYSVFTANGILALVQYWIRNNMALPARELAAMIVELVGAIS